MKKTLLEITQDVLNALDGEEVNSISDTVESLQVAKDIESVFWDLIGRKDWQFLRKLTQPTSVADLTKPTHLLIPERTKEIETLWYNRRDTAAADARIKFKELDFYYPDEFLVRTNARDNTASNYDAVTDFNGAKFIIRTDYHPTFYTTFDERYIVCDAYKSTVEDTLQGTQSQMLAKLNPTWTHEDGHVADLPAEMFPLFVAECMSFALAKKEGQLIQKTEQTAGRQQRHMSQTHGALQNGVRLPNYGRKSSKAPSRSRSKLFGPRS